MADATGGTITYSGGKTIHTFTTSGTFVCPGDVNVETLVIAGGGGGGSNRGGGGGAGGWIYNASFAVSAGSYPITVGNGGSADNNGQNSVFSTLTAIGGGRGGQIGSAGSNGGAGGGAGSNYIGNSPGGGAGTAGQGYNGGGSNPGGVDSPRSSGGGGGISGVGVTGSARPDGGAGATSAITGVTVTYCAGGGGGDPGWDRDSFGYGIGGSSSVGGNGGTKVSGSVNGTNGTVNTGSGGGGGGGVESGGGAGGSGGSGIVIISYTTGSIVSETTNYLSKVYRRCRIPGNLTGRLFPINGLTNYWNFESDATDLVSSNNGTESSITHSTGKIGNGAILNATTDYITIAPITGSTITIAGWYYYETANTGSWNTVFCRNGGSYHHILINGDSQIIGFYNSGWYPSSLTLQTGNWYFIVCEKVGTNQKIYINDGLYLDSATSFDNNTYPFGIIGNYAVGQTQGARGILDEIGVWNRVLTAKERTYLYNKGNGVSFYS